MGSAAAGGMHLRPVEVPRARRGETKLGDPPACLGAREAVVVAAPELAVGRAVAVAVPRVEIREARGAVGPVEGELDVRDVVTRRGEELLEGDGDRLGDRGGAD